MCGVSGGLWPVGAPADALLASAAEMAVRLAHRGPDDAGVWCDPDVGVALANRRLAIVDPGPAGAQPCVSHCGRFVVTLNGAVFRHRSLAAELGADVRWRGHSDTEVLTEWIARRGLVATLERIDGMFAFAAFDRERGELHLVRDRFGQKPLCHATIAGGGFRFASEVRALEDEPGFDRSPDPMAVAEVLDRGVVRAPRTIWRGARQLPPGTRLVVGRDGAVRGPIVWWSAERAARAARASRAAPEEFERELERRLDDAVRAALDVDVPLAVFLSGGVDSALVAALAARACSGPLRTFTLGFDEAAFDESRSAEAFANALGARHTTHVVTANEAAAVVRELATIYDEPFGDSSQIAMVLLSRSAVAEDTPRVKVALTGDGGDEFFCGYERYFLADRAMRWPRALRRGVGALAGAAPWLASAAFALGPARGARPVRLADKLARFAAASRTADPAEFHRRLTAWWDRSPAHGGERPPAELLGDPDWSFARRAMLTETVDHLPNDLLAKTDRAAMHAGLETRLPLLDREVFELAWSLPDAVLTRDGRGKWPLRALLRRLLPDAPAPGPKRGFGVPLADWLRGPLAEWSGDLLAGPDLDDLGVDRAAVRAVFDTHQSGRRDRHHALWPALMLAAWWRNRRR